MYGQTVTSFGKTVLGFGKGPIRTFRNGSSNRQRRGRVRVAFRGGRLQRRSGFASADFKKNGRHPVHVNRFAPGEVLHRVAQLFVKKKSVSLEYGCTVLGDVWTNSHQLRDKTVHL